MKSDSSSLNHSRAFLLSAVRSLEWLRELESDFKDYSDDYLEFCDEDIESAEQILEAVAKWMEVKIAEYQVCMIEGQ